MIEERDEKYRLICAKRGTDWQVEARAGAWSAVGSPKSDLDAAITSAKEKFAEEHAKLPHMPWAAPKASKPSSTDLSDLFI